MKLLIIGAGGLGKCCYEIAEEMNCFQTISFVDDNEASVLHKMVIGKFCDLNKLRKEYDYAFVAIGNNSIRKELTRSIKDIGYQIPTLIHPHASVSKYCEIEEGCVIFSNVTVEPESFIGRGSIICSHSIVHHNAIVENFALIYSHCSVKPQSKVTEYKTVNYGSIF